MQRWQLIERICGFDVMNNPGLAVLELQMKPALKRRKFHSYYCRSMYTSTQYYCIISIEP